jgi:hypothetical protein
MQKNDQNSPAFEFLFLFQITRFLW